jgi:CrcB protein
MEFARTASIHGADNSYHTAPVGAFRQSTITPSGQAARVGVFVFSREEETVHVLIQIGLVAFGGALGSLARWGVGVAFGRFLGAGFPWGTFFINFSGSLFLGWFSTMLPDRLVSGSWLNADDLKLMVAVGFTGAYTTFSTFEYESNQLIQDGDGWKGLIYILASVALGLIAVRLGMKIARMQ